VKHDNKIDVVVVGAGHAGVEAANIVSKLGLVVGLVSMDKKGIGRMSCNPAIGGVAKGQLVRELDLLGGVMGRLADLSGLQHKMLNKSKGRSVWSPRAQVDKRAYESFCSGLIFNLKNVIIIEGEVVSIDIVNNKTNGVYLRGGTHISAQSVIVTCGTFLSGTIHIGERKVPAGRMGESRSEGITENLVSFGFRKMRLKTGTPPRALRSSIDWSKTTEEFGDKNPTPFSHFTKKFNPKNEPCHTTRTCLSSHEIIKQNIDRSPMYSGEILATGPRYCPSVEDKIIRFSKQDSHLLFLEPEWFQSDQIYINGFSTSLPEDVQLDSLRQIPAFKNIELLRPGYAIEYDCFPPSQLKASLEAKDVGGLFFAGQINGTSGYEEAAAQGIISGINSAAHIRDSDPLIVKRSEGYIGVLVDDLITKDTQEPYRMFTSRAEYRLMLRYSNVDSRLFRLAKKHFLLSDDDQATILKKTELRRAFFDTLNESVPRSALAPFGLKQKIKTKDYIKRPEVQLSYVLKKLNKKPKNNGLPTWCYKEVLRDVETDVKYEGYIKRHLSEIQKISKNETLLIDKNTDYSSFSGLSTEAIEKLSIVKPETFGQACRISGVSPADVSALMVYLFKS
jgi:tRNA uridine 5-carboxymethylaminomethyl modification enzyme